MSEALAIVDDRAGSVLDESMGMRWLRGGSTCLYYAPQEQAVRCGKKSTWRRWCETSMELQGERGWRATRGGSNVGGASNLGHCIPENHEGLSHRGCCCTTGGVEESVRLVSV